MLNSSTSCLTTVCGVNQWLLFVWPHIVCLVVEEKLQNLQHRSGIHQIWKTLFLPPTIRSSNYWNMTHFQLVLILALILNVSCNLCFGLPLVLMFSFVLDPASKINICQQLSYYALPSRPKGPRRCPDRGNWGGALVFLMLLWFLYALVVYT